MDSSTPSTLDLLLPCPCGSGASYGDCCQPLHAGAAAQSPEALMRSRYTAFVLKDSGYLLDTWHTSTRPARLGLKNTPDYCSLQIKSSGSEEHVGWVHFIAIHREEAGFGFLEERSDFLCEDGRWYYLKGKTSQGVLKPARNEPCPCGSGEKFKKCCS
ncbi:YchJ family protein [Allohahella sp. A8]|uniref:YchJ family protein n=1 Tax=Allohahella sp. A8 TaxID=3141461 RepID=UPI003A7FBDA2